MTSAEFTQKLRAAGIGAGIHFWGSAQEQAQFLKLGENLLIHSADITLFRNRLRQELAAVKEAAGLISRPDAPATSLNI